MTQKEIQGEQLRKMLKQSPPWPCSRLPLPPAPAVSTTDAAQPEAGSRPALLCDDFPDAARIQSDADTAWPDERCDFSSPTGRLLLGERMEPTGAPATMD